jgi:hypothetical protein
LYEKPSYRPKIRYFDQENYDLAEITSTNNDCKKVVTAFGDFIRKDCLKWPFGLHPKSSITISELFSSLLGIE